MRQMGTWAVFAAVLLVAVGVGARPGATHGSHGGVRHFSLAAVSRVSASRRVLELSGRGGVLPTGVRRVGDRFMVQGSAADDTLIVDFSHGDPVPPGGLVYDGGGHDTRVGNVLVLRGGHFHDAVYDYSSPSAGSIHLDRASITYRNLQPVASTGSSANLTLDLPPGDNEATIQDDGTPGNHRSEIVSANGTFETTAFTNPSGSLTVNGGGAEDSLTLAPLDTFGAANVTIGAEGAVHADTLTTSGTLRLTAGAVDQPAGRLTVGALGINADTGAAFGLIAGIIFGSLLLNLMS